MMDAYSGTGVAFNIAANRLSITSTCAGQAWPSTRPAPPHLLLPSIRHARASEAGNATVRLQVAANIIGGPHLQLALERAGMLSPNRRSRTLRPMQMVMCAARGAVWSC